MNEWNGWIIGLLVVDIVLTGYGVWAFSQARKSCHTLMLEITNKVASDGSGGH
jgi:hypothetical protein